MKWLVAVLLVALASAGIDNGLGAKYAWVPWVDALATAAKENKPVCMVITKSWCGACKALKPQFAASEAILAASDGFVMTNVGDDDEPRDSKFAPDGGYIPRILFLTPSGEVMDVTNTQGNPRYKYYYSSADQIVPAMEKALQVALTLPPAAVAAAPSEQDL